jgi:hypothetical protein
MMTSSDQQFRESLDEFHSTETYGPRGGATSEARRGRRKLSDYFDRLDNLQRFAEQPVLIYLVWPAARGSAAVTALHCTALHTALHWRPAAVVLPASCCAAGTIR